MTVEKIELDGIKLGIHEVGVFWIPLLILTDTVVGQDPVFPYITYVLICYRVIMVKSSGGFIQKLRLEIGRLKGLGLAVCTRSSWSVSCRC
jgi:hypothetical protein